MTDFLLAVHILCAVLWVGGGVTVHIFGRLARASGDRARMYAFVEDANKIGPRFYAPLSLILLVAGILLVNRSGYEHSQLWITFAYMGWLTSFLIGVIYYSRKAKELDAIVSGEGEGISSGAFLANYDAVARVSLFETAILLLIVVDMAVKPGL